MSTLSTEISLSRRDANSALDERAPQASEGPRCIFRPSVV